MAMLVNNSQRPMSIGGKLLSPHVPQNVDDSYLQNSRVKKLMEEKVLARAEGGGGRAASARPVDHARGTVAVRPGRGVPPPPEPPKQ